LKPKKKSLIHILAMSKTAIVFGAGISGLAAAHELAKNGYRVTVIERLTVPGGLARSVRGANGVPLEYSWRGYGPHYDCAYEYMKQIPVCDTSSSSSDTSSATVFDNLSRQVKFTFTHGTLFRTMSWQSKMVFYAAFAKSLVSSKERQARDATINCAEHFRTRMRDRSSWLHFVSIIGPWVGIDPARASLHHVMSFFYRLYFLGGHEHTKQCDARGWTHRPGQGWLVMNQPTNEAWFDPWVAHLRSKYGVEFHFESELDHLISYADEGRSSRIRAVTVHGLRTNAWGEQSADLYVLAVSPFQYVDIVQRSCLTVQHTMPDLRPLIQDGPHIQIAFAIGFKTPVSWAGDRHAYITDTSPFNITLYRQDEFWGARVNLGEIGLRSLWSGTACITYQKGILYNKPATALTRAEFEREIVAQISACTGLMASLSPAQGVDGSELAYDYFEVWSGWKFDGSHVQNTDNEPKFVDSTHTRTHQPEAATRFDNVLLVGAHTRTTMDLWSMEAAAESGMNAVRNYIRGDASSNPSTGCPAPYQRTENRLLSPVRTADSLLYKLQSMALFS